MVSCDWSSDVCSSDLKKGETWKCTAGEVPVTWMPKAVGKWNSLYLDSDKTPWEDDIACAKVIRTKARNGLLMVFRVNRIGTVHSVPRAPNQRDRKSVV